MAGWYGNDSANIWNKDGSAWADVHQDQSQFFSKGSIWAEIHEAVLSKLSFLAEIKCQSQTKIEKL
jgi:hypothetical protein